MDRDWLTLMLAIIGTVCWVVCFAWMHLISSKQNHLLAQLQKQSKRIEKLSKEEHELIQEVHPQVGEIRENVEEVKATIDKKGNGKKASSRK